jgi:DNA-binding NarL/FixJ family response regulator
MSRIRIALIDDHPVVLAGIRALLQNMPEVELVSEASTGAMGLKAICECSPDIAVIDLSLPDISGMELARRVTRRCPEVKIRLIHKTAPHPSGPEAGARISPERWPDELLRAIRAVSQGSSIRSGDRRKVSPALRTRTGGGGDGGEPAGAKRTLKRQQDCNKQIAGQLEVSVKSVETYKARAAEKKGLHSRADIVRYGIKNGWLTAAN